VDHQRDSVRIVQSWDTAIKAGSGHDASACASFAQMEDGTHRLLDMAVMRFEYPELKRAVLQLAARYEPRAILIEDKASGQSLIQDLKRETSLPILAVMPQGDKVTRFARISPMIEAGQVALPKHAAWLNDFEQEILRFPNGAHDDQVDAFSQYLNWVRARQWESVRVRSL
jgi:predicted phage terminase large subunit-like protein